MARTLTPSQIVIRGEILRRLEEGESLRAICRTEGFPSEAWIRKCVRDEDEEGGFGSQYARARTIGYAHLAEELLEVGRQARMGVITKTVTKIVDGREEVETTETEADAVDRARLHFQALQWTLSKMLPKIYGDKISHEVGGIDGAPIKTANVSVVVPADPVAASQLYLTIMEEKK